MCVLRAPFSNFSFPRSHAVSSQFKPYFRPKQCHSVSRKITENHAHTYYHTDYLEPLGRTKHVHQNGDVGRIRIVAAIHLGAVPEIRRANQIGNAFLHPLGVEGRAPDMGRDLIEKGYVQGVCQLVIELLNGMLRVIDVPRAARSRGGGEQQRAWFGPPLFPAAPSCARQRARQEWGWYARDGSLTPRSSR